MSKSIPTLILGFAVLFCHVSTAAAGVFSGTIESVSAGRISVKIASQQASKSFSISKTTKVTLDGKTVTIDGVKVGQSVTVTTDSANEQATKVAAKSIAAPTPAAAAKTKPAASSRTATAVASNSAKVAPGDWPQYRGPNRDNISQERGLLAKWPDSGPPLAWEARGFGEGYSSVAVVGDSIFTLGTRGDTEHLFCIGSDSGKPRWATPVGRMFRDAGQGNGPRSTPTVDGDRVYALGANGDLLCAQVSDGRPVWQMNILEEFGGRNIVWGISESVLIDGDKLICTPGGRQATIVALNKLTGRSIWRSTIPGNPQAAYSSPIVVEAGNVKQYVTYVHTAVVGVRASDGEPLWGQQASANDTANCSSAVNQGDFVFTASGYGTGGALFRLSSRGNATNSAVVYTTKEMKNHHGGMVLFDGAVYGFDEGIMTCLDLQSGKPLWQNRSVGKGSLTMADGKLYLRSERGPVALAEVTKEGYRELGQFEPGNRGSRPSWAHPVVAQGKLFLRDQDSLAVYNLKP